MNHGTDDQGGDARDHAHGETADDAHSAHAGHARATHVDHGGTTHPEHAHTGELPPVGPVAGGAHEAHAHDRHAGHSVAMFRRKFWLSLALTVPILIWGHMLPSLFGYAPLHLPGGGVLVPILGTAVFAYGGWPFVLGAARELKDRLPGMPIVRMGLVRARGHWAFARGHV